MSTYNEIAFMIYDELGLGSDDGRFNIDHIFFLMKEYRNVLLKQQYVDAKKSIPLSNYQTICIDLETNVDCMRGNETKSIYKIPHFTNLDTYNNISINPVGDLFSNLEWTLISDKRFSAVGNNKWLKNIIYFTVGSDYHLYLKSMNPNFEYLKTVELSALFEDPEEASKFECEKKDNNCDYRDSKFPLESNLVPLLIQLIYKELSKLVFSPSDETNNASDDLAGLGINK